MISWFASSDLTGQMLTFEHRKAAGEDVRILLAEGDSWFSLGGMTSNLLCALDNDNTLIVSCASPGDTLRNMSRIGNEPFWMMLSPHYGVQWDAVLLSAGGNDLLGNVLNVIEGENLNKELLNMAIKEISSGYIQMIKAVRQYHKCPIHAHTYDYPVSDPNGGWFRGGPWVGNKLQDVGISYHRHEKIITCIIDTLADELKTIPDLILHDTRGTLTPSKWGIFWGPRHYANEIHPSIMGYRLLASKWRI